MMQFEWNSTEITPDDWCAGIVYVTIYDETGVHSVRLCTSGGPDKEQPIRLAMAKVAKEFEMLDNYE